MTRARTPLPVVTAARALIEIPAAVLAAVDAMDELTRAGAAVPAPTRPADPTHAQLAADPLGHAAALAEHEAAAALAERARNMCAERARHLSTLGLNRALREVGDAMIAGPIRTKVAAIVTEARTLLRVLDEYDRDASHIAAHGTTEAVTAWQDYHRLQHELDVLHSLWWQTLAADRNAPTGVPVWARPDLVPVEHHTAEDLLTIAEQDPAAGYRLHTHEELREVATALVQQQAKAHKRSDTRTHRVVAL